MGFEPMNTGFADQRVSHFAIGASGCRATGRDAQRILLERCCWDRPVSGEPGRGEAGERYAFDVSAGCLVVRR